jgi:hydrogenase maturation factor
VEEGKLDREAFDALLADRFGADRPDVALGPTYGVDFGLLGVGDRALAVATDPLSVLPALGWERAGRFAVGIALADVAVSGLAPTHLLTAWHLPTDLPESAVESVLAGVDAVATDLGVAVVGGHTGRYPDCRLPWVGAATALAVGDPDRVVRPDGARPGDHLVVTTGLAVESAALLAALVGDRLDLSADRLAAAVDLVERATPVRDALTAAAAGPVTAMHDATEGGLVNACHELATAAGVRVELDRDRVPRNDLAEAVCGAAGVDPWTAGSAGTLLVTVEPGGVEAVVEALRAAGIAAADAGRIRAGEGVSLDGETVDPPAVDAFAAAYARLVAGED